MAGSREETIRTVYECFNEGRLQDLDQLIPPAAVLEQDPTFPDARTWRGATGVRTWFLQITAQWNTVRIELADVHADAEAVLAIVDISVRGRTSGATVAHRMAHLWTFRGQVVERCRFYLDVADGQAAFNQLRSTVADV